MSQHSGSDYLFHGGAGGGDLAPEYSFFTLPPSS